MDICVTLVEISLIALLPLVFSSHECVIIAVNITISLLIAEYMCDGIKQSESEVEFLFLFFGTFISKLCKL